MLAVGQSIERLKEMGIMKILGAHKTQIIRHFISESFLLVTLALFLGIVFAEQLLPAFNNLAHKDLHFTIYKDWFGLLFLVGILLIIIFSTSSYVGFFLLRHSNPLSILKNEISIGKRYRFARTFVILQYFISIVLMITTGIIVRQMNYMLNQPVGFDKENVVVLAVDFPISKTMLLKDKLLQYPLIKNVTTSDRNFIAGSSSNEVKSQKGELISTRILRIDPDYADALRLELIEGRDFLPHHMDDSIPVALVNETFVKAFELEEPVGYTFAFFEGFNLEILGVVRDFHYDSMRDKIQPLIMSVVPWNSIWSVFVRIDEQHTAAAINQIKEAWNEIVPEYLIDYSFLDQNLADQYLDEKRWGKITGYSAVAAIFLSCLGLLGLTGMLVAKRSKEITIRKVNGARVRDILLLLNGEFQIWVIFAFVLSCPVSYLIMNKWIQNFTYRTNIAWWIFVVTGIVAVSIALITVTWRSWRFARRNPVESLRYE
jgi:ABC-type antimicrobial peptide transport system permease subunit